MWGFFFFRGIKQKSGSLVVTLMVKFRKADVAHRERKHQAGGGGEDSMGASKGIWHN